MWQLAMVQGPNITFYAKEGSKRENKGDFQSAVIFLLGQGWEPFSAGESNLVVVWFRRRVA